MATISCSLKWTYSINFSFRFQGEHNWGKTNELASCAGISGVRFLLNMVKLRFHKTTSFREDNLFLMNEPPCQKLTFSREFFVFVWQVLLLKQNKTNDCFDETQEFENIILQVRIKVRIACWSRNNKFWRVLFSPGKIIIITCTKTILLLLRYW